MREYKFRGKRKEDGVWVYGGYYYVDDKWHGRKHYICTPEGISFEVVPETVGQYICRKDKNKQEIYEADIVKVEGFKEPMVVYFKEGYFGWGREHYGMYSFDPFGSEKIEIIGNIYDNPELLKEGKDE